MLVVHGLLKSWSVGRRSNLRHHLSTHLLFRPLWNRRPKFVRATHHSRLRRVLITFLSSCHSTNTNTGASCPPARPTSCQLARWNTVTWRRLIWVGHVWRLLCLLLGLILFLAVIV